MWWPGANKRLAAGAFGLLAIVFAAALASGCAPVHPWQRDRLAHDCMQGTVDPGEAAFDGHVELVREGSLGGTSQGGGGCGCN